MPQKPYEPYVCLPYLILTQQQPLCLGPIRFYPSTKNGLYMSDNEEDKITKYLENAPQVNRGTCICVDPDVPKGVLPELLVDAVYLLYFASTYQDLYYNSKPPKFDAFTHYVPTSLEDPSWTESLQALHVPKNQLIEVPFTENVMSEALGKVLLCAYTECADLDSGDCRRIIRSIRYFIHCFHDKFRNLLETGDMIDNKLFEPEDFLFLVTAFETLYDIDKQNSEPDFKQKLRPVIHLKFGTPMETIWNWIDGFYKIKEDLVHEGTLPDPIFRGNINFEIPYLSFAIKLFIYSVYHRLNQMALVPAEVIEDYMPLAFKGIEREETISFLWTETEILKKISILIMQLTHGRVNDESLLDVSMLSLIYRNMLKYYEKQNDQNEIKFIPTPKEELKKIVDAIDNLAEEEFEHEGQTVHVQELFPEGFLEQIQKRVA